jgi:hypothetical protein
LHIITISPLSALVTENYDLSSPLVETERDTEVARIYRRVSRSIDSRLASTAGPEIGVTIIHRIRSQGQAEQNEMTSIIRGRRLKVVLRTALRLGIGIY